MCMYTYIYIYIYAFPFPDIGCATEADKRGGRVLLIEILSARIARQRIVCLISIRGQARQARIGKFELDEGFQPYHPPFRAEPRALLGVPAVDHHVLPNGQPQDGVLAAQGQADPPLNV